jgi:hypothetical protein
MRFPRTCCWRRWPSPHGPGGSGAHESITFEELVRDAAAIAVVKPARKPRTSQRIDITPAGKPPDAGATRPSSS